MASTAAVQFIEVMLQRTDQQTRDILATYSPGAEVDSINVFIGDGATTLGVGIAAAVRVDFRARITGAFIQELDGNSGSIVLAIGRSQPGPSPSFTSIVGGSPPTISGARYYADESVSDWDTTIERGDILLFSITSVSVFTRLLIALRIRRLEP